MLDHVIFVLVFTAAIGSGLVAGIFFAFSSFVMSALGRLPQEQGVAAMQEINVTVINPVFMSAFLGTGLLCAALVVLSYFRWGNAGSTLVLIASLTYIVGCVIVTIACNVPLNNALAAVEAGSPEAAYVWSRYLHEWTAWNTVRTVAPIVSAILFLVALF